MTNTYGRTTIYVDLTEKQLLKMSNEEVVAAISELMPNIISIHNQNKLETRNLWNYYLGQQDILYKEKKTRTDINNKRVVNWAYAFVDFKKNWILGKPIQYTMLDDSSSEEISILNKYTRFEGKKRKDQEIYEDALVVGRGFRFIQPDIETFEDDEAPFSLYNVDRENCEVIYSSKVGHEQLFSVVETELEKTLHSINEFGEDTVKVIPYAQYTIYLRNRKFVLEYGGEVNGLKGEVEPIYLNTHIVTEYYLNRDRISMIELGKDLFDGVNLLNSLDFDDMEQFVNAIMVFTNAEIDEEGLQEMQELGAVSIKSTENKQAKVEMLAQRLNAQDTQTFYDRLLSALHQIFGIPMANSNGSVQTSDTGKGQLVGQGFTSAGIRAEGDETMLWDCDYKSLKVILKICKLTDKSEIKELKASDVDIKFNRDMSENLLVKTQGLMNLLSCDIPREYAIPIVNLFSDSTAVVKKMDERFGEQVSQQNSKKGFENNNTSNINDIQAQNNNIKQIEETDNQDN